MCLVATFVIIKILNHDFWFLFAFLSAQFDDLKVEK